MTDRAADPAARLLLLDGHSLAYRAFFALPAENFSTSTGQVTNAVYGFTAMLINVLRDEQPTHVAVAFDVSRATFRTEQYAEYKANRSATPSEFSGQVPLIKEVLATLGVPALEREGYEADDVIATLVRRVRDRTAAGEPMDVVVCTGDRDSFQLVGDDVTVLYPKRGVSELSRMTPAAVEERYGIGPDLYPDMAALVGEDSDNLSGVPGVGPKTAAKWLLAHGGLEGVVANADRITGKAGESLRAHLADVLRNRSLNRLVDDLELPLGVDDLRWHGWDRDAVHQVFDGLEFRVLRDRLFATLSAPEPEVTGGFAVESEALGPEAARQWLASHAAGRRVAAQVAVTGRGLGATAVGLAVAAGGGETAYLDLAVSREDVTAWLADPATAVVAHEAKPQLHALHRAGLAVAGLAGDTALAAYLCRPDQRSYDLADLSVRHLGRELTVEAPAAAGPDGASDQLDLGLDDPDPEAQAAAAAAATRAEAVVRAASVAALDEVLSAELAEREATDLLDRVELPLVPVLARMERVGIGVDTDHLSDLESHYAAMVAAAAKHAFEVIGTEINLGSPKQLQVVLFDQLALPKTKRIKTGYTTDADSLQDLYVKTEHPFLLHLLAHRDASRLRQTVEGLLQSVAGDGRIHTTFNQTIAATGRLSSVDPNLQNIPIRTDEGRRIRAGFVVGADDRGPLESLMSADYSQIEMRIMAHLSGDAGLVEAFRSGEDLHRFVGSRVFSVPPAEVTPAMRAKVKAMSYGLAYGLSAFGLSRQLTIDVEEARGLMDEYFERFGGVRDYLRGVVAEARQTGWTATLLGRRRYLPDLTSDNRQRREMAERMALNAPIQGSAADLVKVAMLGVDAELARRGLRSRMLLQVHDELVLEVASGEHDEVEALVREAMAGAAELAVPLEVSVGVGRSWYDAAH
ncbi:MAG: DNA polymerase I [Kineosporiaceae bacterium]